MLPSTLFQMHALSGVASYDIMTNTAESGKTKPRSAWEMLSGPGLTDTVMV